MKLYRPMLADSAGKPFSSNEWLFEVKWDGIRVISYVNHELSMRSRNQKEFRHNFPELVELRRLARNVVLDGEIVTLRDGRVDFQNLVKRIQTSKPRDIQYMAEKFPATYVVFDILEKEGKPLIDEPLEERKRILRESVGEGENVTLSVFVEREGEKYYEAAVKSGLEGIMAKKKRSAYEPGKRSSSWLRIKRAKSVDCIIVGYTRGQGSREKTFGALLLGLYDRGRLVYVGKVGTGFDSGDLERLVALLKSLGGKGTIPEGIDVSEDVTWVEPLLVCQIEYQNVTVEGRLRMARFRGIRFDKDVNECVIDQIRPLEEYLQRRDFSKTPEPRGYGEQVEGMSFVVQEHHARRLHYDLRLERRGVLKSWAVPKGLPDKGGLRRLAVQTEDHPLEYGGFEGVIPDGQYGAGTVTVWDKGLYETKIWDDSKIEFTLRGEKLKDRYVLVRLKKSKGKDWLLLKARE